MASITVDRKRLLGALKVADGLVSGGTIRDVKLEKIGVDLRLVATDYETSIMLAIASDRVEGGGASLTVDARRLLSVLREIKTVEVDLAFSGCEPTRGPDAPPRRLDVRSLGSAVSIVAGSPDDFPVIDAPNVAGGIVLPVGDVLALVDETSYAAAAERSRYAMHGLRLENGHGRLRAVATDGRRLAVSERNVAANGVDGTGPGKLGGHGIVPLKALAVLEAVLRWTPGDGVALKFNAVPVLVDSEKESATRLNVRAERAEFSTRLVEGQYPEWEAVVPVPSESPVLVDSEAFRAAVRQAMMLVDDAKRSVRLVIRPGRLEVRGRSAGVGGGESVTEVPVEYTGAARFAAFNPDFLLDALPTRARGRGAAEPVVALHLKTWDTAAAIVAPNGAKAVLMPVTLGDEKEVEKTL